MIPVHRRLAGALAFLLATALAPGATTAAPPPLRALLVAGGCCHDYPEQTRILTDGISKRARVEWTMVDVEIEATFPCDALINPPQ